MYSSATQIMLYMGLVCILSAGSVYGPEDDVTTITCAVLNVGEVKDIEITIPNNGEKTMVADRVSVCCGNPPPTLSPRTIEPRGSATLVQRVKRKRPGPFTITCGVRLSEPDERQLSFEIEGEARQPISAAVGWEGTPLIAIDYSRRENRLNKIQHDSGCVLKIQLSADQQELASADSLLSVSSKYFELDPDSITYNDHRSRDDSFLAKEEDALLTDDYPPSSRCSEEPPRRPVDVGTGTLKPVNTAALTMQVRPNGVLPLGELRDEIVVSFKNGTECYVPLAFRSVGDVYGESSVLGVGEISRSTATEKAFKICFSDKTRVWPKIAWKARGRLSDAVSVSIRDDVPGDDCLNLVIRVDGEMLPASSMGYLSSHIDIMAAGNEKEIVPLVLYGVVGRD